MLDLKSGRTTLFTDDSRFKQASWLKGDEVVALKEVEGGSTEVWIGRAGKDEKKYVRSSNGDDLFALGVWYDVEKHSIMTG